MAANGRRYQPAHLQIHCIHMKLLVSKTFHNKNFLTYALPLTYLTIKKKIVIFLSCNYGHTFQKSAFQKKLGKCNP